MALLGQSLLAIWNGIAPEAEAEFVRWHVREHIPERVGLPGFLRGRRYVAIDGHPKYFNFYETAANEVLQSPVYRDRLNNPTDWTRRVVSHFRDTIRTVCDVSASFGRGEGAWIEAIRLGAASDDAAFEHALLPLLKRASEADGVVAAHLLKGHRPAAGGTAESALRGQPDRSAAWIVMVEGVESAPLKIVRGTTLSAETLQACGAAPGLERGLYRLQYALSRTELDRVTALPSAT